MFRIFSGHAAHAGVELLPLHKTAKHPRVYHVAEHNGAALLSR